MKLLDPTRCEISPGISIANLESIVGDERIKTLQFCVPLRNSEIESIEQIVLSRRPDITFRVYGHYGLSCDLSFLERTPSVQNLSVDCLLNAANIEAVSELKNLQELTVGVFNLENFDFLNFVPSTINTLGLYQTFSKKPSIAAIGRFRDLKSLYLEGQQKGIEEVKTLTNLEMVVLRSISTQDVSYLEGLEKLWSVDIKLGGIKTFDSLTNLRNLKYLELWQIRGLSDLSFISGISSLQNLFIQSLKQVSELPRFKNSLKLRRLYLEDLKGLTDLRSLEFAPTLSDFVYVSAQNQQPENLLPLLRNENVRRVLCGFGNNKKNKSFEELARHYGKELYSYSEFKYY